MLRNDVWARECSTFEGNPELAMKKNNIISFKLSGEEESVSCGTLSDFFKFNSPFWNLLSRTEFLFFIDGC